MLYIFQIGKEHVGLKAVTEILQDIQYKVGHYLKEIKITGCVRGPQGYPQARRFTNRTCRKAVILMAVIYYSRNIHMKNQHSEKVHEAKS